MYGIRHSMTPDVLSRYYPDSELNELMYQLALEEEPGLLFETATIDILDSIMNPGEPVTNPQILDAVTTTYARFPRTMAALARTLNKYMKAMDLEVAEPVIGTPKKSGVFAVVTAQFPISDGQIVSVTFHAPDSTPTKLQASDELISFRWLLNKRDVTHLVAPEMVQGVMTDISLDQTAKRLVQIVQKNSDKFIAKQREVSEQKQALEETEQEVNQLSEQAEHLKKETVDLEESHSEKTTRVQWLRQQLEDVKALNAKLEAEIAALKQQKQDNKQKQQQDEEGGYDALGHTIALDEIIHPWKPRFHRSAPPEHKTIKKGVFDNDNAPYRTSDPTELKLAASVSVGGKPPSEKAVEAWDIYVAARDAGYQVAYYKYGGFGVRILEKEGRALTIKGANALIGKDDRVLSATEEQVKALEESIANRILTPDTEIERSKLNEEILHQRSDEKAELNARKHMLAAATHILKYDTYKLGLKNAASAWRKADRDRIVQSVMTARTKALNKQEAQETEITGTIKLGGFTNPVPAKPASHFKIGEWMMWNGGGSTRIDAVINETPAYITYKEYSPDDGKQYERRLKKDRLVAIGQAPSVSPAEPTDQEPEKKEKGPPQPVASHTHQVALWDQFRATVTDQYQQKVSAYLMTNTGDIVLRTQQAGNDLYLTAAGKFEQKGPVGLDVAIRMKRVRPLDISRPISEGFEPEQKEEKPITLKPGDTFPNLGDDTDQLEVVRVAYRDNRVHFKSTSSPFVQMINLDAFERMAGIRIQRREKLVDDNSIEYLTKQLAYYREDLEQAEYENEKTTIRKDIRGIEACLAEAEGVSEEAITQEHIDLMGDKFYGDISDFTVWYMDQTKKPFHYAHAYAKRVYEAHKAQVLKKYNQRPEVKLTKRLINALEQRYLALKRHDNSQGATVVVGAGHVNIAQAEIKDGSLWVSRR